MSAVSRKSSKKIAYKAAKRAVPKAAKKAAKKAAVRPKARRFDSPPSGFRTGSYGLLLPHSAFEEEQSTVPAGKLQKGLAQAKRKIDETLAEVIESITGSFEIAEIKLIASFNAEGKFLGFGVGGAMSIELTVRPVAHD